eukprot:TRINITY_DN12773_c1_g1_i5.p1 TRINITY_DN12773_c1_g1~~TRINITY_DN12773_c1_g1_i5.p1  ORF type:complete len:368 (+),score=66.80 TRINITY_DN12773_c1_g1_i5:88-1104(+)
MVHNHLGNDDPKKTFISPSRKRRLRASRLKQRLWSNSLGYMYFPSTPFRFFPASIEKASTDWPLDQSYDSAATQDLTWASTTESMNHCDSRNSDEVFDDTCLAPMVDFAAVASGLDDLNSFLCQRLYNSDSPIMDQTWEHGFAVATDVWIEEEGDAELSLNNSDEDGGALTQSKKRVAELLCKLQSAADLAKAIETSVRTGSSDPEALRNTFLEDYYCLLDPQGVAERLEEERMIEQEELDRMTNKLGHLFVNDPARFQGYLDQSASDIRERLAKISADIDHSPRQSISTEHYDDWFYSYSEKAFQWQHSVPDDGRLLEVLQCCREVAQDLQRAFRDL